MPTVRELGEQEYQNRKRRYIEEVNTLVLSSGGGRGLSIQYALEEFEKNGLQFSNINLVCGVSVGAMCALGVVICDDVQDLQNCIAELPLGKLQDFYLNPLNMIKNRALCEGKILPQALIELIEKKTGLNNPTFKELYEYQANKTSSGIGKEFRIIVSNLTKMQPKICSHILTPDLLVVDAIAASIAVPFVFPARDLSGDLCADGFMANCYPMNTLSSKEKENALGLLIIDKDTHNALFNTAANLIRNIKEFIKSLLEFFMRTQLMWLRKKDWIHTAIINVLDYPHANFNPSPQEINALKRAGSLAFHAYMLMRAKMDDELKGVTIGESPWPTHLQQVSVLHGSGRSSP